jgi:molybdopterin synthase catalytic subunit
MNDWLEIIATALPIDRAIASVRHPQAGGIAVFLGVTRSEGHPSAKATLAALDYEAYEDLAMKQLAELAARARGRWPILRLAILHRTGRVGIEEPSVLIAVSTPHRKEAFQACEWLIDTLKSQVAIWKKEVWSDGETTWVDPGPTNDK